MLVRLWFLLIAAFFTLYAYQWSYHRYLQYAAQEICLKVYDNLYIKNDETKDWYLSCVEDSKKLPITWGKTNIITWLQSRLNFFSYSHLDLWSPRDMVRTWQGKDLDNGIVVKNIEGHNIVFEIYKGSAADGKVFFGDELISINGKPVEDIYGVSSLGGEFVFMRQGQRVVLTLEPTSITIPLEAKLSGIPQKLGVVELSLKSFTPIYFNKEKWQTLKERLLDYDKVVIDLRGNSGGDFVVMLEYLSFFFCDPRDVGYVHRPNTRTKKTALFTVDMDSDEQIQTIETHSHVELRTFSEGTCYAGEVNVLVDQETASTAEIFALAMRLRRGTKILGQTSAGAVLLALWFPTPFGNNYSLSIPVATYKNWRDEEIEGRGVAPDLYLTYELKDLLQGIDNWLIRAAN